MSTSILRTVAPVLSAVMLVYSAFMLLRGHDAPGGAVAGGLIAAAAIAVHAMARGPHGVRRALVVDPLIVAGIGVLVAGAAGLLSMGAGAPFLTGLRADPGTGGVWSVLSTPLLFEIGVYLAVAGALGAVVLALADETEAEED